MQVPLADGQSKILGTLEVNWNINLITRNKGIRKQEILLLEFCKNDQRILQPLQIKFSRWNQIQIWLQEISGYNKQQEDCSICYFNFGPTGDPPLSNLKQPPTSADMPVLNSPLLSFIYVHHILYIKRNIARGTTDPGYWVHKSNDPVIYDFSLNVPWYNI